MSVDGGRADLVVVMGTSLTVEPVRGIVGGIDCRKVLVNREGLKGVNFDLECIGDIDDIVEGVAVRAVDG